MSDISGCGVPVAERYRRNMPGLSGEECMRLRRSRVGIFGCGGVGGYVAEILVRMGVGFVRLVDFDIVESSNLNRQLFATERTLGLAKTSAAARRLAEVSSDVVLDVRCERFCSGNADDLLAGLDLVVNEIDVIRERIELARASHERGIPSVHAAVNTWKVSASSILPDEPFPADAGALYATGADDGVLLDGAVVLTGLSFNCLTAAGLCASEAVGILLGRGCAFGGKRYVLDARTGDCSSS